jgi:hypothetical protein
MKLKAVLTIAAIYQAIIGLGMMFVPGQFGIEAVPDNASPALIEFLRIFGGPMIGIAVLNWLARNLEPSPALNAILLANIVGFGCVALSDVWGVFTGGSRAIAKVFLVIHVLLTVAFVVAWQTRLRQREHRTPRQ